MLKWIKKLHEWGNRHEWLLVLLLAVIVLRLPSLCTPHYYGDEEIYLVMGRAWAEGVPLYQAMFDHKPPLIYIMAGLTKTLFTFRLTLLALMLVHTALFWKLARLFWAGKHVKWSYLSSAVFVLLTSLPFFEGLIVNAELLMMLPMTLSLLMIWRAPSSDSRRFLFAGVVAGVGWLFKVPVVMDALAIALYFFVFREKSWRSSLRGLVRPGFWLYLVGFALPLSATFLYYYLKGHGADYLATVVTVNLGYVSSWETSAWVFNPFKSGLVVRGSLLAVFTLGLYLGRNQLDRRLVLASLWFMFALFGALLSSRPYPHYLQEPIVPFALLVPFLLVTEKVAGWVVLAAALSAGIGAQVKVKFLAYPTIPVYQNFARYVTGGMTKEEYYTKFDNAKRNYLIANYLDERLMPEEKIYVWGSDAAIYNLTRRLPTGGKYIVNFHVRDLNQYDYVMKNVQEAKPKAIVILAEAGPFMDLQSYADQHYVEVVSFEDNRVYWRLGKE